ncbi:MAG: CHAT domain-containing protein, partial [Bacteroidales bacterium]
DICLKLEQETGNKKLQKRYREQAFYFAERNKTSVLQEALAGTEAQKFAGIPDSLLNLEQKLSTDIAYYEKQLASVPGFQDELKYRNRLFLLNRRYDSLILIFEKQYPEYHDLKYSLTPVTTRDIQQVMDNKTAFISYFTGDSIVAIFTVTKKNLYVKSLPKGKFPASLIRDFRKCLLDPDNSMYAERYREYAFDLYQKLIPQNLDKKIKNLIIIPDSELCLIPFEPLLTYKTDSPGWNNLPYLIRKYNISYSYSANLFYRTFQKTLIDRVELSGLKDWLAFAPVFNDVETSGLTLRTRELLESVDALSADSAGKRGTLLSGVYISPLPGTETEVRTILKLFDEHEKKAKVQLGTNANEFALKSGDLRDYACIHLATHGFVNMEKPELSGILLSQDTSINEDGILFSGEIYNLKLNAMLTVLSACETGLGEIKKGEGIIGLTRALLYAGSKNIIVSLWKVADESTSELMIGFYRNMLEKTEKEMYLSGALRKAKLNMIQESRYAHPFFWSPFILIGY